MLDFASILMVAMITPEGLLTKLKIFLTTFVKNVAEWTNLLAEIVKDGYAPFVADTVVKQILRLMAERN